MLLIAFLKLFSFSVREDCSIQRSNASDCSFKLELFLVLSIFGESDQALVSPGGFPSFLACSPRDGC